MKGWNVAGIEQISTANAPAPAGHYVQATRWEGLVHIAGQLPVPPDRGDRSSAPFADQARQALANLLAIADAAGAGPETMLKINAYIVGIENWSEFNRIFAEIFGDAKPARAVIPVPELHHGYLVEVDAVAVAR